MGCGVIAGRHATCNSAAPEAHLEKQDVMCERLIAAAVEATMIVVESKLHGDPIPSLRSHYRTICAEREVMYRLCAQVSRSSVDGMLREHGLCALGREYRADTRNGQEELQRTFIEILFYEPQPESNAASQACVYQHGGVEVRCPLLVAPGFDVATGRL